jgi:hypothetical protein
MNLFVYKPAKNSDTNNTKSCTHNINLLPDKNKSPYPNNHNVSNRRFPRRNKPNITTKDLNILVNQPYRMDINSHIRGKKRMSIILHIYSLTSTVTTITKSFNISFVNQAIMINGRTTVKFILFTTLLLDSGIFCHVKV